MSTVRLGDICQFINGGAWTQSEFSDSGYPVLKVSNCKPSGFLIDDVSYIPLDIAEKSEINKLHIHDVIIATVGSHPNLVDSAAGRSCIVTEEVCGYYLNQNAVCLRTLGDNILNQRYLGFLTQYFPFQHYIQNKGKGAANQMRIAISAIKDYTFELPEITIQNRVANILSAYDDLIENNQKQIKLLEEAAQRLYKEWFVDLRFPGYENTPITDGVPQGWKKLPLRELIEYEIGGGWGEDQPTEKCDLLAYVIRGTDLYDVTHGNAKSIPYRFHAKSNLDSRKLQDGDIVFEVSGGSKNEGVARTALITESLLDFLGGDVICASFCKLIRFKDKSLAKYMYDTFQYLRNSGETIKYDKRSASSIVNYRWKDFLEQQLVFVPTDDVLKRYNALAENMQKSIVNKAQIIEQAKQARDRLLPKLMSGELEV